MNKKKISIYALHLGFGGVEQYVISLANILSTKFNVKLVVTYKVMDKPAFAVNEDVEIIYLINDKPRSKEFKESVKRGQIFNVFFLGIKNLKMLIQRKKRNINYSKTDDSDIIITTRILHNRIIQRYTKKDIIKIATEHNHPLNENYENDLIDSINGFDAFVPISPYILEYYRNRVPENTVTCSIPFYVENPNVPLRKTKDGFIFIGRLEPEKQALQAIQFIEKIGGEAILNICGDGSQKKDLMKYVAESNLENQIIFNGFLEKNQLNDLINNSKYMLVTSQRESFGIAVLESMMLETIPLVFPSAQGVVDILMNFPQLVSKEANIESLKDTFRIVDSCNENLRMSLKEEATKYNYDTMKDEFLSLIDELVELKKT